MPNPVDPDALAEAVAAWDDPYDGAIRQDREVIVAAARAFLESPTAEWCYSHDANMAFDGDVCWKVVWMGGKPKLDCDSGRMRLVPESPPNDST